VFVADAEAYLREFGSRIEFPQDLAYAVDGTRHEIAIEDLPVEQLFMDIGAKTIANYEQEIGQAKTLFVNGPAGVYEDPVFEDGTKAICNAIADADGYSVIGGGDTVTAATKFVDLDKIDYVCTAGGAMVRYLSGKKLPLIEAMEKAYQRDSA
jgi:phosphoglycerate kinase